MAKRIKDRRRYTGSSADIHFLPTARIVNTTPPKVVVAFGLYPEALRYMEVRDDVLELGHNVSETNLTRMASPRSGTGTNLGVNKSGYFVADFGVYSDPPEIPNPDDLAGDESAVVGINVKTNPSGIVRVTSPVNVSLEVDSNHTFDRYTLEN